MTNLIHIHFFFTLCDVDEWYKASETQKKIGASNQLRQKMVNEKNLRNQTGAIYGAKFPKLSSAMAVFSNFRNDFIKIRRYQRIKVASNVQNILKV